MCFSKSRVISEVPYSIEPVTFSKRQSSDGSKRVLDISICLLMIIAFSPIMLLVALFIVLEDRGPIFFYQLRHGKNKKPFKIIKFRTMTHIRAESKFKQTVQDDPRVTRMGRYLRRTSLDELPQLFNVLKGDMSLIGPRPHAIEHDHMYMDQIKNYERRYDVLPGLSGLAQINGSRGATETLQDMEERLKLDLEYIEKKSIQQDLDIIAKTPKILISGINSF